MREIDFIDLIIFGHYQDNDKRLLRLNIVMQDKHIHYVQTAENLSNYDYDNIVIRPKVKNLVQQIYSLRQIMFFELQYLKNTPKKVNGDDLDDFKDVERFSSVVGNMEQWVLKIDLSIQQQG